MLSLFVFIFLSTMRYNFIFQVVKLLGVLTTGPSLVLVLELMAGGLGSVLSDVDNPVTIPQYKAYIRMLLNGLLHLHQISIMHRVRHTCRYLIDRRNYRGLYLSGLKTGKFIDRLRRSFTNSRFRSSKISKG